MRSFIRSGLVAGLSLALFSAGLYAAAGLAQTTLAPPVTTPPPPGAQPPTGGPNTPPMTEPANKIEREISPGGDPLTEAQARSRLEREGFAKISGLKKDDGGTWRGTASKNGATVHVGVDQGGHILTEAGAAPARN